MIIYCLKMHINKENIIRQFVTMLLLLKLMSHCSYYYHRMLLWRWYFLGGLSIILPLHAVSCITRIITRGSPFQCLNDACLIDRWAINTLSNQLLSELLPGPVTLVLKRRDSLNPSLNPTIETVGVRIPNSKFIVELAQHFDKPLALTSANVSNEKSTLAVEVSSY